MLIALSLQACVIPPAIEQQLFCALADEDGDGYWPRGREECMTPSADGVLEYDCNDTDASIHPGAEEVCNGIDDDCTTVADDDESYWGTFYADLDGDGYGTDGTAITQCDQPSGYVTLGGDCDDDYTDSAPNLAEWCDGRDNDCNGFIDEDGADGEVLWFHDDDEDGYGISSEFIFGCSPPDDEWATQLGDCDDDAARIYPGAWEICDGEDQDCDGEVDEEVDQVYWFEDADGDGYGNYEVYVATKECADAPGGDYVADADDCDDEDASISPAAIEVCDEVDNDCNGEVDDDADGATAYYEDNDNDGYGNEYDPQWSCHGGDGLITVAGDCDDTRGAVNPDGIEDCEDGHDNDCNGIVDDGEGSTISWTDADGDGYGDPETAAYACEVPSGSVDNDQDCDDTSADALPGGTEVCDGVDNDCDGEEDEDAAEDAGTWYADEDGDGYGGSDSAQSACEQPSGMIEDGSDCDDSDADISPDADEVCDAVDNDCDDLIDDDDDSLSGDLETFYEDGDGDGIGTADSTVSACEPPSGYVTTTGDCDDADASVTDEDASIYFLDADGDGYGDPNEPTSLCEETSGYVSNAEDCDDSDVNLSPGVQESCDGVDNDCDDDVDEGETLDGTVWYADADGDGDGDPDVYERACDAPSGYVETSDDCDDTDATVYGSADEVCDDVDNDCDGSVDEAAVDRDTWYYDTDGDGWGTSSATTLSCDQPTGYVGESGDCDETDTSINPGGTETCDGVDDEDCDGDVDESDAADATTWYVDDDGDGYGDAMDSVACDQPSGTSDVDGDCDDGDASASPGETEVCGDGVDNDCSGDAAGCELSGDTDTSSASLQLVGEVVGDEAGHLLSSGDHDSDGVEDLYVGAPQAASTYGRVYIFNGPVTASTMADADVVVDGYRPGDSYGDDVFDFDADGDSHTDLVMSAPTPTGGWEVYVLLGPVSSVAGPGVAQSTYTGPVSATLDTLTVVHGSDLDADGAEDLLVGAPTQDGTGVAYLVNPAFGDLGLASDYASVAVSGASEGDLAAYSLVTADVTGDGLADLIAGAPGESTEATEAGAVFILHGPVSTSVTLSDADASVAGATEYGTLGSSVTAEADFDGDGLVDLIAASVGDSPTGSAAGQVFVLSGVVSGASSIADEAYMTVSGSDGDLFGASVDIADLDSDGSAELVVGAPQRDPGTGQVGSAFLFYGVTTGSLDASDAELTMDGLTSGGALGSAVWLFEDIDGDGQRDVLLTAPDDGEGAVYGFGPFNE